MVGQPKAMFRNDGMDYFTIPKCAELPLQISQENVWVFTQMIDDMLIASLKRSEKVICF